jgi:hypothetical protein
MDQKEPSGGPIAPPPKKGVRLNQAVETRPWECRVVVICHRRMNPLGEPCEHRVQGSTMKPAKQSEGRGPRERLRQSKRVQKSRVRSRPATAGGPEGRHRLPTAECLVARRSLSRNCRDSPERDEPNTREGVRKTATLSLPKGCRGFPGGKRHQCIGRC